MCVYELWLFAVLHGKFWFGRYTERDLQFITFPTLDSPNVNKQSRILGTSILKDAEKEEDIAGA